MIDVAFLYIPNRSLLEWDDNPGSVPFHNKLTTGEINSPVEGKRSFRACSGFTHQQAESTPAVCRLFYGGRGLPFHPSNVVITNNTRQLSVTSETAGTGSNDLHGGTSTDFVIAVRMRLADCSRRDSNLTLATYGLSWRNRQAQLLIEPKAP